MDIKDYLIFGGVDSRDYDIEVFFQDVDHTPKRVYRSLEVVGRNGAVLIDEGRYEDVPVIYDCIALDDANRKAFVNAIASKVGYFRLQGSFNSDEYYYAVFEGDVEPRLTTDRVKSIFSMSFTRRPQRFLTSGEVAQNVSSGDTVTNPTQYDSQPLVAVEGYGTVSFNGYEVKLVNETLGQFELYSSDRAVSASDAATSVQLVKTFSLDTVNTGDTATLGKQNPALFNAKDYIAFASGVTATSQTNSTTGASGTTKGSITATGRLFASVSIDAFTITIGTASTKTRTATYTIVCNDNGTTRNVVYVLSASIAYNGSNTVTYTVTRSFTSNPNSIAYGDTHLSFESGATSVVSSVSVLGNPTYIDCELGEAYMIKNGEYVSLNAYIDLGSDVPVLSAGDNEFTFDNTITSVEVIPRWWQL